MSQKNAIIIAHYHKNGLLRSDTIDLLKLFVKKFKKVILVSTFLKKEQVLLIPDSVEVIIRENTGYDFFSYRLGILSTLNQGYDTVYLTNTSFVCIDIDKFEKAISEISPVDTVYGITKSVQHTEHIQSYFYAIPSSILNRYDVINWWLGMIPIDYMPDVVTAYEFGFSNFLKSKNILLDAVYCGDGHIDPTHHDWQQVYDKTGIIKIRLLIDNPYWVDLSYVYEIAKDPKKAELLNQGINN